MLISSTSLTVGKQLQSSYATMQESSWSNVKLTAVQTFLSAWKMFASDIIWVIFRPGLQVTTQLCCWSRKYINNMQKGKGELPGSQSFSIVRTLFNEQIFLQNFGYCNTACSVASDHKSTSTYDTSVLTSRCLLQNRPCKYKTPRKFTLAIHTAICNCWWEKQKDHQKPAMNRHLGFGKQTYQGVSSPFEYYDTSDQYVERHLSVAPSSAL